MSHSDLPPRSFAVQDVTPSEERSAHREGIEKTWKREFECEGIEAHSRLPENAINLFSKHNMLAETVHKAFYHHHPLVLTPDAVWITLVQGLAHHVKNNAETLRSKFVEHEGKEEIEFLRLSWIKGDPNNDWESVFSEIASKIKARTKGDIHTTVTEEFSTSTPVSKICFEISLMDVTQSYFSYGGKCGCGIPYITLDGKADDWMSIRERAETFEEYDLKWWTDELLPVLDKFVEASQGNPDVHFFKSICNLWGASSHRSPISGWLQVLFPYIRANTRHVRGSARRYTARNEYLGEWRKAYEIGREAFETINISRRNEQTLKCGQGVPLREFPSGISSAPFTFEDLSCNKAYQMGFYGGLTCMTQDEATGALKPEFGWAILDFGEKTEEDVESE